MQNRNNKAANVTEMLQNITEMLQKGLRK